MTTEIASGTASEDIDLREIMSTLRRRRRFILIITLFAFLASLAFVNLVSPKYTSEARLLLENQDNYFARPDKDMRSNSSLIDPEDVLSQVQLAQSQSVSRAVIKKLNLGTIPEFDPVLKGIPFYMRLPIMLGLVRDPTTIAPEDRVLESYSSKVNIFAIGKSRVVSAEVTSQDPKLAAKIANSVTEQYLEQQTLAKKTTMQNGSAWLLDNIEPLRQKVIDADAKVEAFRTKSNLFLGTNNNTIANQQLSELNTQLSTARSTSSDQQARAQMIRKALQTNRIFDFSEVLKDDLIRRLSENRSNLRALLASEERIYLSQHPRLKELNAQIADLEGQIRLAAERTARSLENDARAASARVAGILSDIEAQKKLSAQANGDDVQLKALEREAKSLREQFDNYSSKVNEAAARDVRNPTTADARIVMVALPPSTPSFPKVLPIILLATLGALFLSTVMIVAGQLLKTTVRKQPFAFNSVQADSKEFEKKILDQKPTLDDAVAVLQAVEQKLAAKQPVEANEGSIETKLQVTPLVSNDPDEPLEPFALENAKQSVLETSIPVPPPKIKNDEFLETVPTASKPLEVSENSVCDVQSLIEHCINLNILDGAATILMLGSAPRLGMTTASIKIARDLSEHGRVILVDLNQDHPNLDQLVETHEPDGLTDAFSGEVTIGDAIYKDLESRAHIMPFGFSNILPTIDDDLTDLVDVLQKTYDYVILDSGISGGFESTLAPLTQLAVIGVQIESSNKVVSNMSKSLVRMGAKAVTILQLAYSKNLETNEV